MSYVDRDAKVAQTLHVDVFGQVTALDAITEIVHHLGDARHADAADADK